MRNYIQQFPCFREPTRNPQSTIPHSAFRIPHFRKRTGGFTLLELLVGLTIATFIMGSAAVVFVTTMDNWDRGNREQRLLQAAQTTADLIERYLRCAVAPGKTFGTFTGEDLSSDEVDGHRLTFCSTAEGRFPRSMPRTDLSEIEFAYDPSEDAVLTMRIDATPDEDPTMGGLRVQLSTLVQGFQVMYYDGVEWASEWYEEQLPKAVEFHLMIGDPQDTAADGTMRTREISRLVWLPMGKSRPPEATGSLEGEAGDASGQGNSSGNQGNMGSMGNDSSGGMR